MSENPLERGATVSPAPEHPFEKGAIAVPAPERTLTIMVPEGWTIFLMSPSKDLGLFTTTHSNEDDSRVPMVSVESMRLGESVANIMVRDLPGKGDG
jgi:hypothetical protein